MKMKKILAALTAAALSMGALGVTAFAEDNVINVTAENAQDVLDGKEGSIDGKTINFTESIDEVLELALPTRYEGSNTTYYSDVEMQNRIDSIDNLTTGPHYTYARTISNVRFVASEQGIKVAGFHFNSGHVASAGYDAVRDIQLATGQGYYRCSGLENITFQGLTITGKFEFGQYLNSSTVSGITIDNCTFTGDKTKMDQNSFGAIRMMADSQYYNNITVSNCEITDYFQGMQLQGISNVNIINNTINNTKHNAIALQSSVSNPVNGIVSVKENYIDGAHDRAIRLGNISGEADMTINNNIMVNSGDSDGELIKAGTVDAAAKIDLENNYWNGSDVNKAVANLPKPVMTGVAGGTFKVDITNYVASNCEQVDNGDGTYGVKVKPADITTENVGAKTGKDETVATGFLTKISNAGVIKSIRWTVTSGDTPKDSEKYNLDISLGGDALLGLVVNGLSDGNATATAVINE